MYHYAARMTKVTDGDTLRLDIDLGLSVWMTKQSVRLYGVNCPEMGTPEGLAAKQFVLEYFGGLNVPCTITTLKDASEKYGRWLVVVRRGTAKVSDPTLNEILVQSGHAVGYYP